MASFEVVDISPRGAEFESDMQYKMKTGSPEKTLKEATEGRGEDKTFPSLFPRPSLLVVVFVLLAVTTLVVLLTVLSKPLEDSYNVSRLEVLSYYSVPFVSVIFTFFHVWLALWMTFYPVKFRGIFQLKRSRVWGNLGLPGWQGIIPFKAEEMARTAVKLMTTKLLDIKDVFGRIHPATVARILEPLVQEKLQEIVSATAMQYNPDLWRILPAVVKDELIQRVMEDAPNVISKMMEDITENIEEVFDLEEMIVSHAKRDPDLLNRLFITCGYSELEFIRNSGATMGFLFGILQLIIWFWYQERLVVFPGIGLLVGSLTNYIALLVIFWPLNPIKVGCFTLHGLFLRRKREVAKEYARVAEKDFLNPKNIAETFLKGKYADSFISLVHSNIRDAIDKQFMSVQPVVRIIIGSNEYDSMRVEFCKKVVEFLPETISEIESYIHEAMDIQNTLETAVGALSDEDFEALLHPVFQADEWKLVALGGILGVVIGFLQVLFL